MGLETKVINLLRKTKLSKNPTISKFLADLAIYPPLGVIPGKFQEKLGQESGIDARWFGFYQISMATGIAVGRYFLGESVQDVEYIGYAGIAMKIWSIDSFLSSSFRISYMAIAKKPIGALSLEIPYRLFGFTRKKVHNILEKHEKEAEKIESLESG